jgi:hyperpolarization activated cyclic nucleotide-gated potassium channel 2
LDVGAQVAILSRKRIAIQYCKGWFVFDVVSSVPLDLMIMQQSSTVMKLPRVLRLIRIFRLVKVLRLSRAVRFPPFLLAAIASL